MSEGYATVILVREREKMEECNECEYNAADVWVDYSDNSGEFICYKCLTQVPSSAIVSLSDLDRELVFG
jgi:hypothetical protein